MVNWKREATDLGGLSVEDFAASHTVQLSPGQFPFDAAEVEAKIRAALEARRFTGLPSHNTKGEGGPMRLFWKDKDWPKGGAISRAVKAFGERAGTCVAYATLCATERGTTRVRPRGVPGQPRDRAVPLQVATQWTTTWEGSPTASRPRATRWCSS